MGRRGDVIVLRCVIVVLPLALSGCVASGGNARDERPVAKAATISIHLAYDEPREGLREMTDETGAQVYVSPRVELTSGDIDAVRALHSDRRSVLQIVLNRIGAQRLYALTRDNQSAARLAVLINDKLVCAQPIYGPIPDGRIYLLDVFSRQRAEELAAALNRR
jgi:preprotein translocase subunit SecD